MNRSLPEKIFGQLLINIRNEKYFPADVPAVADSRKVVPGAIFAAISGTRNDGSTFIPAAIAAGAATVIHQEELPEYRKISVFVR